MFRRRLATNVPLSNGDVEREVTLHLAECRRARSQGADIREIWHEDRMNAALDILLFRGYGAA